MTDRRSRSAKLAEALGVTRSSREPLVPAGVYWGLAVVSLVVGVIAVFGGGRRAIVGWGLLVVAVPLMVLGARRARK